MNRYLIACILPAAVLLAGCHSGDPAFRAAFENPGGMWMPHQLADQADTLRALGVRRPERLSDPQAAPLAAIVWMGGCSASFVSPDGLIITNHHCANRSLQAHSTPACNLFDRGFLARGRDAELPGEIGKKVWVTRSITEVTDRIRDGLADIDDPLDRYETIERRIKQLIAEHEDADAGVRCSVKSYFLQQQYYLIKQLELRDVRLVYAPPSSVGAFGGFEDNWQWPRHTGDFTFYRAYVAPDGSPAEYAPENVPYKPRHYLRIADEPLEPHDFVMVAGYPGRTQRWNTAQQVRFAYEVDTPARIAVLRDVLDIYTDLAGQSQALRITVTPSIKGVTNYLQLLEWTQANIRDNGLLATLDARWSDLAGWVRADPQRRQRWMPVLEEIAALNDAYQATAYRDYLVGNLIRSSVLVDAAHTIIRMAEERPKDDLDRDRDFQRRNWDRIAQDLQRMQTSYDPAVEKAMLTYYLNRLGELEDDQLAGFSVPADIDAAVAGLFAPALTLDDPNERVALFGDAALADLQDSGDPAVQFALALRPLTKAMEDAGHAYAGRMALLAPEYVAARRAFYGRPLAPDANGTLRVTYGTVRGYRPAPDAPVYEPFTTLAGVLAKHTGVEPFDAPPALVEAAEHGPFEPPYVSEALGAVPVNFLSDLDITGGNSGSATLNRNGRLVGLLFDGNAESMASNLLFLPEITRGIHVDIRYVLWIAKYVDHADTLLAELGVE